MTGFIQQYRRNVKEYDERAISDKVPPITANYQQRERREDLLKYCSIISTTGQSRMIWYEQG
jgi:hypothetical protein